MSHSSGSDGTPASISSIGDMFVSAGAEETPIQLVYVPSHLYHILFELLKNAMRAVVEHYPDTSDFPPIQLLVVNGQEDLTIKVRLSTLCTYPALLAIRVVNTEPATPSGPPPGIPGSGVLRSPRRSLSGVGRHHCFQCTHCTLSANLCSYLSYRIWFIL